MRPERVPDTSWTLARTEQVLAERAGASRTILGGAALPALGVMVTALTYAFAAGGGGTYLVMWGPMTFGAITLVKGFVQLRHAA